MGKFNLNQLLSGTSIHNAEPEVKEEKKTQKMGYKIIPISVYDLVPSKDNFYSMEQIQDLKTAIELAGGIKQNLTVTPLKDGRYKVLAGHRRRLASLALIEEGKHEYEYVPCGIESTEDDSELQAIREELLLIVTNSQRDKTDWDKVEEVKRLRNVLERLKEKAKLPGRVRDIIAETLNTSAAQVGRMDAISKNLVEEFKEEFKEQRVGLSTAYELSGLPEEKQKEAFEDYKQKGSLSIKDVKEKKQVLSQEQQEGKSDLLNIPSASHKNEEYSTERMESEEVNPIQDVRKVEAKEIPEVRKHHLKIYPRFYQDVKSHKKTFEIRFNDREYKVGDICIFQEYDPAMKEYIGSPDITALVTYALEEEPWVPKGYICMSINVLENEVYL